MQEHTVLDLTPLGIDRQAAIRHRREGIGLRACVVDIPALKDIPLGSGRLIVIGAGRAAVRLVVGRQIRVVGDILLYLQLALGVLARDSVIIAVIVRAVHVVQRIDVAGVITIDIASIVIIPDSILLISVRTICFRRISTSAFREADKVYIVFSFREESILGINTFITRKAHTIVCSVSFLAR